MDRFEYVMVTPAYLPHVGGVERHVHGVHRELARQGVHGLVLVLRARPDGAPDDPSVRWLSPRVAGIPYSGPAKRNAVLANLILRNPDARLHFHDYGAMRWVTLLLRATGAASRSYLTFHGWEGVCPPNPAVVRTRQRCAALVASHLSVGAFIDRWYGTRATAITHGAVDTERFAQVPPMAAEQGPLHLAYLGRLAADTGLPTLLEGAASSAAELVLDAYGDGPMADAVRTAPLAQQGRLHLHAPVENVPAVLARAAVIFASGYLTILEALCARRIVIAAYDNPLRRDYLALHPAAESMFICGSPTEVAAALHQCASDLPGALQRAEAGWSWAQTQTWDRLARQYRELWGLG